MSMRGETRIRSVFTILAALSLTITITGSVEAAPRPGQTELVSISSSGEQGKACTPTQSAADSRPTCRSDWATSISATGRYVAFSSPASDLVPGDSNHQADVFVHDSKTGVTQRVSISSSGAQAEAPPVTDPSGRFLSGDPSISANGRYIAFLGRANNLVPGDTNIAADVFVHDRQTAETTRVSLSSSGDQTSLNLSGIPQSLSPSISADGRFVSFSSNASNLVPDDTNQRWDVFVRDLWNKRTERASVASGGRESTACSPCATGHEGSVPMSSISASGRWVVFDSVRTDLVDGDTNMIFDVFVHDRKSDRTERVSVSSDGQEAEDLTLRAAPKGGLNTWEGSFLSSSSPDATIGRNISADGRYVAFASTATNLVPNDTNGGVGFDDGIDVFVHDRVTHRTRRVSVAATGEEDLVGPTIYARSNVAPSISLDGRYITWASNGYLVDEPWVHTNSFDLGVFGVMVHDFMTGATDLASWMVSEDPRLRGGGSMHAEGNGSPDISSGGRYVSFQSREWHEGNSEDANPLEPDVFVRDRGAALGTQLWGSSRHRSSPIPPTIGVVSDLRIPPSGYLTRWENVTDVGPTLSAQGADLYGISLAYRPQDRDLIVAIELEHMPKVLPGVSPIFYGLRFGVEDKSYEVRATSLLGGTFELFDCTNTSVCTKVADLRGGYGTTGMRVVFSLPLDEIGLENGGELDGVEAFSAIGTLLTGPVEVLDTAALK